MGGTRAIEAKVEYAIRSENVPEWQTFRALPKFHGTEARVDSTGTILYTRSYSLPDGLPEDYTLISPGKNNGVIFAASPPIKEVRGITINHLSSVEKAIAAMDHILEPTKTRGEIITAIGSRAHELLDLFDINFSALTNEQFKQKELETVELLRRVQLDPESTIFRETQRMRTWLAKGSLGEDSLGRKNKLISMMALSAAYRRAKEKYKGVGPTLRKFAAMREAFIIERIFSRKIFEEVVARIGPRAFPASDPLTNSKSRARDVGIVLGMLNHMRFQLRQPHVKPYRTVGRNAEVLISQVVTLLKEDKRQNIVDLNLFGQAHTLLSETLNDHSNIY